jgi:D-alanyl-D-alanine carboxypeptidase/D-alanyl-D-alanine-endopeptidase (penicillin-binding protein 4)
MYDTVMKIGFSRRHTLAALGAAWALPVWAGAPARSLRPMARDQAGPEAIVNDAEALVVRARLGGEVGFAVARSDRPEFLEERGASVGLPPASVVKALTAAYALFHLGPDFRFETTLMATGPVENGVLRGDLVLIGNGDPNLDTDDLFVLSQKLAAAGVTSVTGQFLVWAGGFRRIFSIDPEQPDHLGYNPAVSGLNLNYNRIYFEWARNNGDYSATLDARSPSHRPVVDVAQLEIADRGAPVYQYRHNDGRDIWSVARGALGTGGARWIPVRQPELYAGEVFASFTAAQGMVLPPPKMAETAPEGRVLIVQQGRELHKVVQGMLKYSTNLTAEVLGLAATQARGFPAPTLQMSASLMSSWARQTYGLNGVRLVDHSGLGDRSRMSASDMVRALQLAKGLDLKPLLKPIRLPDRITRLPAKVFAKTGTLHFVSGLAGYLETPDGSELTFAVFCADVERRAGLTRAQRERPRGARGWNTQARALQHGLIERWAQLYGSSKS